MREYLGGVAAAMVCLLLLFTGAQAGPSSQGAAQVGLERGLEPTSGSLDHPLLAGEPFVPARPTKTVQLNTAIGEIALDPKRPLAYLAGIDSGTLLVFSLETLEIVREIPVGDEPFRMALEPQTDRLYVALVKGAGISVVDLAAQSHMATWPTAGPAADV